MSRQIIVYCDESTERGAYFSDFYGAAVVESAHLEEVVDRLREKKASLDLGAEVKWTKISELYAGRYVSFVDELFDLICAGKIRIRLMFTQNVHVPTDLTRNHVEQKYFILYYQFIKYGLGLVHANPQNEPVGVRLFVDKLPDTRERVEEFKSFVCALNHNPEFRRARLFFKRDHIVEADSHKHEILQGLDVVLGSMQFRLNGLHLAKPPGSRRRGKRTLAKERVYKHIQSRIKDIHPGFNIGISTGHRGDVANRWHDPYRHWLFVPKQHEYDASRTKKKK